MGVSTNTNDYLTGRKPVPTSDSGHDVLAVRFEVAVGTGDLGLNGIIPIGKLPAGHIPVDVHVDGSDLDSSTAALIFDAGVLDTAGTGISTEAADGGSKWGSTTAVNTAFSQRLVHYLNAINAVAKSNSDRTIALKVATAPTTAVAGTVGLTLFYKPA